MESLYEAETPLQVLFVTGLIGGGAGWLAGRAIAQTWRPFWHVVAYMAMLGAAVRFVHFALFGGTLLSPASYAADTLYLLLARCTRLAGNPSRSNGDAILLALRAHQSGELARPR